MYVQVSPHFPRPTRGDNHGQDLWVRVRAHPRLHPSTDDDSTHTPLSHGNPKSAGTDRAVGRAVGRADDGRATDLARASSTFGRPVASLYPASTRSIHEVRESDASIFFLRARSRPSRARTRRRASVSRRRGWMDGWVEIISAGRAERGVRMDGMDDDRVARSRARMNERVDLIFSSRHSRRNVVARAPRRAHTSRS